jgi:hypothetical protein
VAVESVTVCVLEYVPAPGESIGADARIVYVEDAIPELMSPAFVPRDFTVLVAAKLNGLEYVLPAEHVPGLEAAGSLPSVV